MFDNTQESDDIEELTQLNSQNWSSSYKDSTLSSKILISPRSEIKAQERRQYQAEPIKQFSAHKQYYSVKPINMISTPRGQKTNEGKLLFKKVSNGKPIYQYFFVTGMQGVSPIINYCFPKRSGHCDAILSLIYSQNSMRQPEVSPSHSKSRISSKDLSFTAFTNFDAIKDTFVIPLLKETSSLSSNDKEYLIACQVEDRNASPECMGWPFPRFYCFITSCKFIKEFKKLIQQFLIKVKYARQNQVQKISEKGLSQLLKKQLESPLRNLYQKSADENKNLNYYIGEGIRFEMDIPSLETAYKIVDDFKPHNIMNLKVVIQYRLGEDELSSFSREVQMKLFGILLISFICETKIILYSNVKSKISQAILHATQIIKPFAYVHPIMMAALREGHEEYINAPMPLVLGMWGELKKHNKQKIQIFLNKKMNFLGMIEKAKLDIPDGIVINLDTGLIFGGGLKERQIGLAQKLNGYWGSCKHVRQIYRLFDKISNVQADSTEPYSALFKQILGEIQHTQLYQYYKGRQ